MPTGDETRPHVCHTLRVYIPSFWLVPNQACSMQIQGIERVLFSHLWLLSNGFDISKLTPILQFYKMSSFFLLVSINILWCWIIANYLTLSILIFG